MMSGNEDRRLHGPILPDSPTRPERCIWLIRERRSGRWLGHVVPECFDRGVHRGAGACVRESRDELAEPIGDRVDGRLAGGDIDHEVVDVVVAGA
jgi:hypothetical protein